MFKNNFSRCSRTGTLLSVLHFITSWSSSTCSCNARSVDCLNSYLHKGPFIATQLNSTSSSWIELHRRSVYSDADATQLNSTAWTTVTDQCWTSWPSGGVYSDASLLDVELSCVGKVSSDPPTQLNLVSTWVELRRYKRAFTPYNLITVKLPL